VALCPACNKDRFIIYRRYQGKKIKPPRCLNCIMVFPPNGIVSTGREYLTLRPWVKVLNHGWTIIKQTSKEEVWYCPYCRQSIMSKKQGVPSYAGCQFGRKFRPTRQWFVDLLRCSVVLCPLCDRKADIVTLKRVIVKRPRPNYWPYTCGSCYDIE
jgi:hypothetical protein